MEFIPEILTAIGGIITGIFVGSFRRKMTKETVRKDGSVRKKKTTEVEYSSDDPTP